MRGQSGPVMMTFESSFLGCGNGKVKRLHVAHPVCSSKMSKAGVDASCFKIVAYIGKPLDRFVRRPLPARVDHPYPEVGRSSPNPLAGQHVCRQPRTLSG